MIQPFNSSNRRWALSKIPETTILYSFEPRSVFSCKAEPKSFDWEVILGRSIILNIWPIFVASWWRVPFYSSCWDRILRNCSVRDMKFTGMGDVFEEKILSQFRLQNLYRSLAKDTARINQTYGNMGGCEWGVFRGVIAVLHRREHLSVIIWSPAIYLL